MDDDWGKGIPYLSTHLSLGALTGCASGYAFRQGGRVFGALLGGGFIALQTLSHLGYVNVDWKKIEGDYNALMRHGISGRVDKNAEGSGSIEGVIINASNFMRGSLPAGSGFSGGFLYGLTGSLRLAALASVGFGGVTTAAIGSDSITSISPDPVKQLLQDEFDAFKFIGNKFLDSLPTTHAASPDVNLHEALQSKLQRFSIEELRRLEKETRNDIKISFDLEGINTDFLDTSELLEMIESAKKFVKGR